MLWDMARLRPDLFLHARWAVALTTPNGRSDGDRVKAALVRARAIDTHYDLVKRIASADGKAVEIYYLGSEAVPLLPTRD